MRILFINNTGGGFADHIDIPSGTTVAALFEQRVPHGRAPDYLIRVNRQPVAPDQILLEGDRVSLTPVKIEGATRRSLITAGGPDADAAGPGAAPGGPAAGRSVREPVRPLPWLPDYYWDRLASAHRRLGIVRQRRWRAALPLAQLALARAVEDLTSHLRSLAGFAELAALPPSCPASGTSMPIFWRWKTSSPKSAGICGSGSWP